MSDLTSRLSKAVLDYLETANLRSEPFSLSRIEEVIAGVMATDSKVPVNVVRHSEYLAQQKALEQYWATIRGRTELRIAPNESLTGFLKCTDPAQVQEPSVDLPDLTSSDVGRAIRRGENIYRWDGFRWEVQETTAPTLIDKDHADFLDSSAGTWGMGVSTTSPVTYDLSADPDAFKKAKVGDAVIVNLSKPWEAALMSNYVIFHEMWRRADVETLGDGFTSMNRIA